MEPKDTNIRMEIISEKTGTSAIGYIPDTALIDSNMIQGLVSLGSYESLAPGFVY